MRTRVVGKKDFDLVSRSDSPLFFGFIKLGRERERRYKYNAAPRYLTVVRIELFLNHYIYKHKNRC